MRLTRCPIAGSSFKTGDEQGLKSLQILMTCRFSGAKNMTDTQTQGIFEGWAILELMGHRKLGGYLKEESIAGTSFLRIDVPDNNGGAVATQFYSPSAVYCITPTTEDVAKAFGVNHQPTPVTRWELPAARESRQVDEGFVYDEYDDERD